MVSYMARFTTCKFRNFSPILREFRQAQTNDLLSQCLPINGMQQLAMLHVTSPCDRYKRTRFPQPILKPIGPDDYKRWREYLKHAPKPLPTPILPSHESKAEIIPKEIFQRVDQQIKTDTTGRLFAVVQISGKQFKITAEDIIVIQGHFAPTIGEELQLEKVLLVGSSDFTLVGRPLLNKDLLKVDATVVEKTLSHIIIRYVYVRRKQRTIMKFSRRHFTMLRINSIQLREGINEIKDVDGLQDKIF